MVDKINEAFKALIEHGYNVYADCLYTYFADDPLRFEIRFNGYYTRFPQDHSIEPMCMRTQVILSETQLIVLLKLEEQKDIKEVILFLNKQVEEIIISVEMNAGLLEGSRFMRDHTKTINNLFPHVKITPKPQKGRISIAEYQALPDADKAKYGRFCGAFEVYYILLP